MSEAVSIRFPNDLMEKMVREASEKDMTISELVRQKVTESYETRDAKVIAQAVKESLVDAHSGIITLQKMVVNSNNVLRRFCEEQEKVDTLDQQWHKKNNDRIVLFENKMQGELTVLKGHMKEQTSLFEELYPKKNTGQKYDLFDTLHNFTLTPGFYLLTFLIFVLLISVGLSYHFTGEYWLEAFRSLNNFWKVMKWVLDIFSVVFLMTVFVYPFTVHLLLKHIFQFGWRQEIRFLRR